MGTQPVTDPDEVVFEIWRANDENHEKIPIEHAGDGIYELEKTFTEEGDIYIYSHVTAEGYTFDAEERIRDWPAKRA